MHEEVLLSKSLDYYLINWAIVTNYLICPLSQNSGLSLVRWKFTCFAKKWDFFFFLSHLSAYKKNQMIKFEWDIENVIFKIWYFKAIVIDPTNLKFHSTMATDIMKLHESLKV